MRNKTDEFGLSACASIIWVIFTFTVIIRYEVLSPERTLMVTGGLSFLMFTVAWIMTGWVYLRLKKQERRADQMNLQKIRFKYKREHSHSAASRTSITSNGDSSANENETDNEIGSINSSNENTNNDDDGHSRYDDLEPWVKNPLLLEEILSTRDGFEMFTNHLVLEYSVENMLFVLEMEIIKDEIIANKLSKTSMKQKTTNTLAETFFFQYFLDCVGICAFRFVRATLFCV